jgi:hypothetical protein
MNGYRYGSAAADKQDWKVLGDRMKEALSDTRGG